MSLVLVALLTCLDSVSTEPVRALTSPLFSMAVRSSVAPMKASVSARELMPPKASGVLRRSSVGRMPDFKRSRVRMLRFGIPSVKELVSATE
ncbi:hypothetical protein BC567DRAFT_237868 [Phyllosticta citribraziliensis]